MRPRFSLICAALVAAATAGALAVAGPAQAATPDRWGFAYVANPTTPVWTTVDTSHQWGSWKTAFPGLWADGMKVGPGRFLVRFPQVGSGPRGVVHVTPVNRTGIYCEAVRWYQSGADEIVAVQCDKPGGVPADTPFTVLWTLSSGVPTSSGSHAYVQYGSAAIVQVYNSTGAGVAVAPLPVGQYKVTFSGVGMTGFHAGDVQVTAVNPDGAPRRCKVFRWFPSGLDIIVYVNCYDQTGSPVNSQFVASYHRQRSVFGGFPPKTFGYVWMNGPVKTNYNYPAGGFGFNSVAPLGSGYRVKYPLLALLETHAQITAVGAGSKYCNLMQPWTVSGSDEVVDVICFDNTGTPASHDFLSTFTSRT